MPDEVSNQKRERPTHQHRDGCQQDNCGGASREIRGRGKRIPPGRLARVGRDERRESPKMRQRCRDDQAHRRDDELDIAIRADQGVWLGRVPPVGPAPNEVAASTESQHEDGHDQRRGVDGVAEDVAELTDPDDLIDQPAETRTEEEEVEHGVGGGLEGPAP